MNAQKFPILSYIEHKFNDTDDSDIWIWEHYINNNTRFNALYFYNSISIQNQRLDIGLEKSYYMVTSVKVFF